MTTLITMGIAIAAVFTLITAWVLIDQWARKSLGERSRCCHSFEDEGAEGCCGKHHETPRDVPPAEEPVCPHGAGKDPSPG